jgi:hypothetical protein
MSIYCYLVPESIESSKNSTLPMYTFLSYLAILVFIQVFSLIVVMRLLSSSQLYLLKTLHALIFIAGDLSILPRTNLSIILLKFY